MQSLMKLRRFLDATASREKPKQVCELCGAATGETHSHVVDVENRRLMCTCRPCYLLFTHEGAGGGRFRSTAERFRKIPGWRFGGAHWEALDIPVGIAFFLKNSKQNRVAAFYPSPAGATESGISLEIWDEIVRAVPEIASLQADIEALLICKRREGTEAWMAPVDACYELVGRIRGRWRGFDGGTEVWAEIDAFLAGLESREVARAY